MAAARQAIARAAARVSGLSITDTLRAVAFARPRSHQQQQQQQLQRQRQKKRRKQASGYAGVASGTEVPAALPSSSQAGSRCFPEGQFVVTLPPLAKASSSAPHELGDRLRQELEAQGFTIHTPTANAKAPLLHVETDWRAYTQEVLGTALEEWTAAGAAADHSARAHQDSSGEQHSQQQLQQHKLSPQQLSASQQPRKPRVVVEFSSPNIGKPFHAGHLRSTIIGNVLANLHAAAGAEVTRINYLGDWGRQVGLLALGFDRYGSKDALQRDGLSHLLDVYVKANRDLGLHHGGFDPPAPAPAPAPTSAEKGEGPEKGDTVIAQARGIARRMEEGDEATLVMWDTFRQCSLDTYHHLYERLGVRFDEMDSESAHVCRARRITRAIERRHPAVTGNTTLRLYCEDGALCASMQLAGEEDEAKFVILEKGDGTTTYISRDMAAILDRHDKYHFDQHLYVVGYEQSLHFKQLLALLPAYDDADGAGHSNDNHSTNSTSNTSDSVQWKPTQAPGAPSSPTSISTHASSVPPPPTSAAAVASKCEHVQYGLVTGLSTRKGNIVLLEDMLHEARQRMLERLQQDTSINSSGRDSRGGPGGEEGEEAERAYEEGGAVGGIDGDALERTAEVLALSSLVVQDLRAKRVKNYTFSWARVLDSHGDTGTFLQYTHVRLCSIQRVTAALPNYDRVDAISECPHCQLVIHQLAQKQHALALAVRDNEPSLVVQYMLQLARAVSSALPHVRVKGASEDVASQRMALFVAARTTLGQGLQLLGLTPLQRM